MSLRTLLRSDDVPLGHLVFEFATPGIGYMLRNATADFLSRNAVEIAAQPDQSLRVEFDGVPPLKEYARVTEMLDAVMGVRSVQLAEAAGPRATFAVVTRTGVDGLQNALLATSHLERIDPKAGGTIAFRYRP